MFSSSNYEATLNLRSLKVFVFTLHHFKQKNIRKNTQPGMVSRIIIEYTFCFYLFKLCMGGTFVR